MTRIVVPPAESVETVKDLERLTKKYGRLKLFDLMRAFEASESRIEVLERALSQIARETDELDTRDVAQLVLLPKGKP